MLTYGSVNWLLPPVFLPIKIVLFFGYSAYIYRPTTHTCMDVCATQKERQRGNDLIKVYN